MCGTVCKDCKILSDHLFTQLQLVTNPCSHGKFIKYQTMNFPECLCHVFQQITINLLDICKALWVGWQKLQTPLAIQEQALWNECTLMFMTPFDSDSDKPNKNGTILYNACVMIPSVTGALEGIPRWFIIDAKNRLLYFM